MIALLLAAATPQIVMRLSKDQCPATSFDKQRGYLGSRAMIADDGWSMVVQCGGGVVWAWRAGDNSVRSLGVPTLFRAAQAEGIVDPRLRCPWSSLIATDMHEEADCDVLDHSDDGGTYVLRNAGRVDTFVVQPKGKPLELTTWQRGGALWPRVKPATVLVVDGQSRPERLERLSLPSGRITSRTALPDRNLLFENGEGGAGEVSYASAPNLLLITFGGAFRVAQDIAYVRAYTAGGREVWSIRGALPKRDESLIVGDNARLVLFDHGRRGVLGKTSDRTRAQLIDLGNGSQTGILGGWPMAASRRASRVLI